MLLHGGGGSRREWFDTGYVERLQDNYTVILVDLRGHGESSRHTDPAAYEMDRLAEDVLAAVDACGVDDFAAWAMSYGGKIGRHLGVHSRRVTRLVLMGTPLGRGVEGERRQEAIDFLAHWEPTVQAQADGEPSSSALSASDRDLLGRLDVPVMLAWVSAMLAWASVEPADFLCPTLWLIGSEDRHAMASLARYEATLDRSMVQVAVVKGLDHQQVFDEIDRVLPTLLGFTGR